LTIEDHLKDNVSCRTHHKEREDHLDK